MNAAKAKRRWLAWCRYVAATGTTPEGSRRRLRGVHAGQAKAYQDHIFAGRSWPRGARAPYYPTWAANG